MSDLIKEIASPTNPQHNLQATPVVKTQTSEEIKQAPAVEKALNTLLKSINLNQESLTEIRKFLSNQLNLEENMASKQGQILLELLKQFEIAYDTELVDPKTLASKLLQTIKKQFFDDLKNEITKRDAITSRVEDSIRAIIRELDSAFKLPQSALVNDKAQTIQNSDSALSIIKILTPELLKSIFAPLNDTPRPKEVTELIKNLIRSQLETLQLNEGRIKSLLLGNAATDPITNLVSLLKDLSRQLSNRDFGVPQKLTQFTEGLLKDLSYDKIENFQNPKLKEIFKEGLSNLLEVRNSASASLPSGVKGTLHLIEIQLRELLESPDFMVPNLAKPNNIFKEILGTSPQSIKNLLKQLIIDLPVSGNAGERQLLDAAINLENQLEAFEREPEKRQAIFSQQLRKSLVEFKQYLAKITEDSNSSPQLNMVDSEALKSVYSSLATQDLLQRLAPSIKALGEPYMLLFPFVIGNFLSKAQVTFYPESQEKNQKLFGSSNQDLAQTFIRISIVLSLPKLGNISCDLAYRNGEILLNLGFEKNEYISIVESKLLLLRQAFVALGFFKIEISIAEYKNERLSPDLLGNSSLGSLFSCDQSNRI